MKNIFKKIIVSSTLALGISFAFGQTAFAQWDTTTGGSYTGGWDTTTGGNYTGGWDTTTGGSYTGGWDTTTGGNYTGGWDTTTGGNYTGGWDTTTGGSYTGGWDTTTGGNYTGGWDTTYTTPTYTGGWDTTSVVGTTYTTPTYTTPTYTSTPTYVAPTYTTPTYVAPTYTYTNPTYTTAPTYVAPTYTNITPVTTTTVCSDGTAPINGSCARTNVIPTTSSTVCSNGTTPVNGVCNVTNVINTTTSTVCSDGTAPINGSCTRTNVLPVTSNTVCSDGLAPTNGSCTRTNVVNTTFNTICSDGFAPVNGSCTRTNVIHQSVVKFNNVVTSVPTQVTNTSGRCNGIGLIANNAQSTGWFEYGETSKLGRTTASASIGSAATSPFSNVLTNLKPNTSYYCRAVMQNQYGIVKGEIVEFVTKKTVTTYVKNVTTVKKVATTTVKKSAVTCSDGSTVSVKDNSSSEILNQGQKLVTVSLDKTEGNLSAGNTVSYRLSYKNASDSRLSGVLIKVMVPQEISVKNTSAGNYDVSTHTIVVNQDGLDARSEGSLTFTGTVNQDAPIGKSIVATAYVLYTVPSTSVQDEVTAYVVGSITPAISNVDTGAKHVIGQDEGRSFLPDTLVEWLALVAVIAIIYILGRSIYASYHEEEVHHAH